MKRLPTEHVTISEPRLNLCISESPIEHFAIFEIVKWSVGQVGKEKYFLKMDF